MTLTLENTSKIVQVNGVPARLWEGTDDQGTYVIALITRVAVRNDESVAVHQRFQDTLEGCQQPSIEAEAFPLKLII